MLTGSVDRCAEIKRVPLQCHRKAMLGLWLAPQRPLDLTYGDGEVLLNVLRCQLTYWGQVVTSAEARFSNSLRPRKPEDSLGRTVQDGHLDSHTAPEF